MPGQPPDTVRRVPVEVHARQVLSDRPQVPDVDRGAVIGDDNQLRPVGAECGASSSKDTGQDFRAGRLAACLGFDQEKGLVRLLDQQKPSIGCEAKPLAADLPRFFPGADGPELARRRAGHQPFPVGAKGDPDESLDIESLTRAPSLICQTWAPLMPWLPVANHFPSALIAT